MADRVPENGEMASQGVSQSAGRKGTSLCAGRKGTSPSVKCRLGGGTAEPVAAVVVDGEHRGRDEPGYRVNQQQVLE